MGLGKLSVGPPYFESVFVPLMIPLMLLLGFGPFLRWKSDRLGRISALLLAMLAVSLVGGGALAWAAGDRWSLMVAVGLALFVWIVFGLLYDLRRHLGQSSSFARLATLPLSFWGMVIAHLGVAAFIVGVTVTSAFSIEKDLRVTPGETVELGGYAFRLAGIRETPGPNYTAHEGVVEVTQGGKPVAELHPQKRIYTVQGMPMTEAAIDWGFTRDLYVALGEPLPNGDWAMRVYHKPYVRWIWIGTILMALGGLIAVADRRYRLVRSGEASA
jgi:cytochrome c-type biogenesis protein CcmF